MSTISPDENGAGGRSAVFEMYNDTIVELFVVVEFFAVLDLDALAQHLAEGLTVDTQQAARTGVVLAPDRSRRLSSLAVDNAKDIVAVHVAIDACGGKSLEDFCWERCLQVRKRSVVRQCLGILVRNKAKYSIRATAHPCFLGWLAFSRSKISYGMPCFRRQWARTRPPGPAPMMMILSVEWGIVIMLNFEINNGIDIMHKKKKQ